MGTLILTALLLAMLAGALVYSFLSVIAAIRYLVVRPPALAAPVPPVS